MHLKIIHQKDKMYSSSSNSLFPDPPNDDMWKKFDLEMMVTPPLSPTHESNDTDLENMPFDLDTEDLMLFDDENIFRTMRELTFPESPPDSLIQENLIQDIMWSAPTAAKSAIMESDVTGDSRKVGRNRCDSCSGPFRPACVDPQDVFPGVTQIGGTMSQTRLSGLGLETPSDSEEEIDVVTVEKQYQVTVPAKRKLLQRPEDLQRTKTVTLTIEHKPTSGSQTVHKKCNTPIVQHKVDCPTDVHNYSLPLTSLKRVRAFLSTPDTHHKSVKRFKRDNSVPSDLRKVAQKLKSSVGHSGSYSCSSSRSSSDSEDFCDTGKRTQHNVLERKRRTDLKNSFFHLRDSVPELEGQERAPKVLILRKASQYIHKLREDQNKYDREIELLRIKREKLKRQLSRLRDY